MREEIEIGKLEGPNMVVVEQSIKTSVSNAFKLQWYQYSQLSQ